MMSARSDSQSTILPLPSSPHWAPITTTLAISTTPGESLPSMLAVNSRWHGAGARYRRAVEQNFKLSQGGAGRVSRGELQQRAMFGVPPAAREYRKCAFPVVFVARIAIARLVVSGA